MGEDILLEKVYSALGKFAIKYRVLECPSELSETAAFCEYYGLPLESAANTILVMSRKVEPVQYVVCVVLGTTRLDVNKKVCELMGVKRASFADSETTIRLTDMQIGGVTAVGIADLPIYIDSAVMERKEVVMGGGNRTSKVLLDPNELTKLLNITVVEGLAKVVE